MNKIIKIHPKDNVAVALTNLVQDEIVDGFRLKTAIAQGHKIAWEDIQTGDQVIKYGYPIGIATKDITQGELVHSHNLKTGLEGTQEYTYSPKKSSSASSKSPRTFHGYRREDGQVGIRNELWIVPTVGCINGTAQAILDKFQERVNPIGLDGMEIWNHNYGCSQLGDDHQNTVRILGDIVKHPNAGGVLVLGLGCENNTLASFRESLGEFNKDRVRFLVAQEVADEVEEGCRLLEELYVLIQKDYREEIPVSELTLGLKCGGSDGFSGITANPLLGFFSDWLISQGGTTILTEVPEMFGAETILMNRAEDDKVFQKTVRLINDFKEYFLEHDQPIYENPSPGNKAGGITTLEEKSLGCTQKGGQAAVVDVLGYGERVTKKGLNLLNAPGNDLVASTALGASGCQLVLFTTGRGTPFGSFVPTMKISTNSDLFNLKPHWIDFDAGGLAKGRNMEEVLDEFIDYVLRVASGEAVNNETNRFKEIAIFKTGVTL